MLRLICALGWALPALAVGDATFALTILHTNDVHARIDATPLLGREYGGYARRATLLARLRASEPNPILLSAGDVFQGTFYFNCYEGMADLALMNLMRYDAMAVGNHEFDRGVEPLRRFARAAQFPLLAANIEFTEDSPLRGLIHPHTVLRVGGRRVGIVGAITPDTPSISSPGETVRFIDLLPAVQRSIDTLTAEGVQHIVVLSHCGYELEQEMARKLKGVDIVVGGHSHTLLGTFDDPAFNRSRGPYPTVVDGVDGKVLVVQAYQWGILLGRIRVDFDSTGRVVGWSDTPPLVVNSTIPVDPHMAGVVAALRLPVEALGNRTVAECAERIETGGLASPMGALVCDAHLAATRKAGAVVAITNAGGVRAALDAGPVTLATAYTVQPFNNSLVVLDLTGDELKRALEWGVRSMPGGSGGLLYVSEGSSYAVDATKPVGNRIVDVVIDGKPLDLKATYGIALNSFLAGGGDGHEVLKRAAGRRIDTGTLDIDAFVEHLTRLSPVRAPQSRRIRAIEPATVSRAPLERRRDRTAAATARRAA